MILEFTRPPSRAAQARRAGNLDFGLWNADCDYQSGMILPLRDDAGKSSRFFQYA
jgi:hypothetical protein